MRHSSLFVSFLFLSFTQTTFAQENFLKNLDGVKIEAVEGYPNRKLHEGYLGLGAYPFNAYYTGLSLNGGYIYHFNQKWGWEVLKADYFFTFDSDLRSQLADRFNVGPEQINRIEYMLSSNAHFDFVNGKFVFLENFIRHFRATLIGGGGLLKTSQSNRMALNLGLRFGVFTSDRFSWNFEVRESVTLPTVSNYVTFNLNAGMAF